MVASSWLDPMKLQIPGTYLYVRVDYGYLKSILICESLFS
jgi:hypothetical protein